MKSLVLYYGLDCFLNFAVYFGSANTGQTQNIGAVWVKYSSCKFLKKQIHTVYFSAIFRGMIYILEQ